MSSFAESIRALFSWRSVLWPVVLVGAAVAVAAAWMGGLPGFLAQGGAAQVFTFLVALACLIGGVRLLRALNISISQEQSLALSDNLVARSIIGLGMYAAVALCVLAAFT